MPEPVPYERHGVTAISACDKSGKLPNLQVMECLACGGIVVDHPKTYNAYMGIEGNFYYKRTSQHGCIDRLSRGLGPRKETK